jgi:hypothetical protein
MKTKRALSTWAPFADKRGPATYANSTFVLIIGAERNLSRSRPPSSADAGYIPGEKADELWRTCWTEIYAGVVLQDPGNRSDPVKRSTRNDLPAAITTLSIHTCTIILLTQLLW